MKKKNFYKLHSALEPYLCCCFNPKGGGKQDPNTCSYLIKAETRLSIAICYFAGGSLLDIMLTHGVLFASVYTSVWGVVDCMNECKELELHFPNHNEQGIITKGFQKKKWCKF
eukprot:14586639-Ditylum_brightwellii.AAC.1